MGFANSKEKIPVLREMGVSDEVIAVVLDLTFAEVKAVATLEKDINADIEAIGEYVGRAFYKMRNKRNG